MKADLQKMKQIQALKRELDVINQDLSCSDPGIPYRDRLALNAKQAQVEEQLSNLTGHSLTGKDALEPAYFGNVRREWGDKLELAQPPIEGEWLPKSAVYALVDLMVVVFSRPKGLFKECVKRIQSGVQNIEGSLFIYFVSFQFHLYAISYVIQTIQFFYVKPCWKCHDMTLVWGIGFKSDPSCCNWIHQCLVIQFRLK